MREALAAANHDFIRAEPRKAGGKARPRPGLKRSPKSKPGFLKGRVATLVAGLACAGVVGGIVINALVLQKTRHPAPLFARHPQHQAPVEKPAPAVPLPAAQPKSALAGAQPTSNPQPETSKAEAILGEHPVPPDMIPAVAGGPPAKKPQDGSAPAMADPITQFLKAGPHPIEAPRKTQPQAHPVPPAQLIASGATAPKPEKSVAGGTQKKEPKVAKPDRDIEEAQRRLIKLGFALEADGRMGEATRQAIRQYERDHKLTVDGEVSGILLKQFAKEAGGKPPQ